MSYRWLTAVPAYGRDYRTKAEVLAAWNAGRDFRITAPHAGGTYVNKDDLPPNVILVVRYYGTNRECLIHR